jgi:hypothetical protein
MFLCITAARCVKEINICNNSTGSPRFATVCFGTINNKDGFETSGSKYKKTIKNLKYAHYKF